MVAEGLIYPMFDISTHAPLAGRDRTEMSVTNSAFSFQPTRPLRGATSKPAWWGSKQEISTHAPLAGRDVYFYDQALDEFISTHAPLAGRDTSRIVYLYP